VGGRIALLAGLESFNNVLLHLKAILMLVCLKMLVIFLTCGDEYVKVAHFVPLLEVVGVGDLGEDMFCCILSLNRVSRARGMSLLCAMCNMCCHSLYCCSLSSGSESILLMRNWYAAILCPSR